VGGRPAGAACRRTDDGAERWAAAGGGALPALPAEEAASPAPSNFQERLASRLRSAAARREPRGSDASLHEDAEEDVATAASPFWTASFLLRAT
jgi:hypothetical protein